MRGLACIPTALLLCGSALALCGSALAQGDEELRQKVRIEQRLGEDLPLDVTLRDHTGKTRQLGDFFADGKPVVLAFVYYECPSLCNLILNDVVRGLKPLSLDPGEDFEVVAISIDHEETPELAAAEKREGYLHFYGREGTEDGWHFLTGAEDEVRRAAHAAGFHYAYDEESDEYAHGSAIFLATPDGRISRVFFGLEYAPRDLKLGLVEASKGELGNLVDNLLLLCFHYDPATGRYGFAIQTTVRIAGLLTVAVIALFLWRSLSRERAERRLAREGSF